MPTFPNNNLNVSFLGERKTDNAQALRQDAPNPSASSSRNIHARLERHTTAFELTDQLPPLDIPNDFPDDVALIREERERR